MSFIYPCRVAQHGQILKNSRMLRTYIFLVCTRFQSFAIKSFHFVCWLIKTSDIQSLTLLKCNLYWVSIFSHLKCKFARWIPTRSCHSLGVFFCVDLSCHHWTFFFSLSFYASVIRNHHLTRTHHHSRPTSASCRRVHPHY